MHIPRPGLGASWRLRMTKRRKRMRVLRESEAKRMRTHPTTTGVGKENGGGGGGEGRWRWRAPKVAPRGSAGRRSRAPKILGPTSTLCVIIVSLNSLISQLTKQNLTKCKYIIRRNSQIYLFAYKIIIYIHDVEMEWPPYTILPRAPDILGPALRAPPACQRRRLS
jgi:hypothetical protein